VGSFPTQLQPSHLEKWNGWITAPPPRIARLKEGYRFWIVLLGATLVIVPILVVGFLISESRADPPKQVMDSDLWSAMPFVVLPLMFLFVMVWIFHRDRRLVTHGEVSIGKVVDVRFRRRGPVITYEFLDRSGRLITTSSPDNTRSLSPGMVIPVFFDRNSPETNRVALCESVYEVGDSPIARN